VANTISNVIPQLLAQSLLTLREQAITPRLVNRSIGDENRDRGDTIDVPIASAIATRDVTAAVTHATNQDSAPTKVQVILNQWKEASFHLSDKDQESVMDGVIPMQAAEAVKALANGVDSYILGLYTGVYSQGGTAGTTPFATNLNAFKSARTRLNAELAPMDPRFVLLDPDAEGNALLNSVFLKADERGDQGGVIRGNIGTKLGADWFLSQNLPTHTAGTFGITGPGSIEVKTSVSAGKNTVIWQGVSTTNTIGGSLVVGDLFTIAGDQYVVSTAASVAAAAGATLSVQFTPALRSIAAAGATIVKAATHVVNLLAHRDAFAFASRTLARSQNIAGLGTFMSSVDPVSGLALRLEVSRQYKQTTWSFDLLYGATLVRPQLAARILG
jgi:hypothetical protein